MPTRRELDALLLHEPGELGFYEAVKLVQDRVRFASEAAEAGDALLEQGDAAQARTRYEEGVELTEFAQSREANMWRVVLRDKQKTASVYAERSVTSRNLGSRRPGDRVQVASNKGDWVRLHADEGWGEEPAWMLINRSGAAKGMGIMLEPEVSAQLQTKARELYLSLRVSSARACLAVSDWTHAALHATAAVLFEEDHFEALFLRAVAHISLDSESRIEEAREELQRLQRLQPERGDLQEHLQRAEERLRELRHEQDEQKSQEQQQRLVEEARLQDLEEVRELTRGLRESFEEKQRVEAEALVPLEDAPPTEEPSTFGEGSAANTLGTLGLLAQVSRLASRLPPRPVAAIQDLGQEGPAEAGGAPEDVPAAARPGLGLRGRGLGGRGRGLGRGKFSPGVLPQLLDDEDSAAAAEYDLANTALATVSGPSLARPPPARVLPSDEADMAVATIAGPSRAGPPAARILPSEEAGPSGSGRRVARPKRELRSRQLRAARGDGELARVQEELKQTNAEKARAIEEEDFRRAAELKKQAAELTKKIEDLENRARDQATSELAQLREEVRDLEAAVRIAAEGGEFDRAVELRQRRDKVKASMRKLEWMHEA